MSNERKDHGYGRPLLQMRDLVNLNPEPWAS